MKPKVSETKDGGVLLNLPVPNDVQSVKDSRIIRNWQMKYAPLSDESMVLMFADEYEAQIRDIEVTQDKCYIELKFAKERNKRDYLVLMKRF